MNILIFGGAGFIGANFCNLLLQDQRNQVTVFDNLSMGNNLDILTNKPNLIIGDMTDFESVSKIISSSKPNLIIHLAANSDISASSTNPQADLKNTLMSTVILADAVRRLGGVENLVFASSSAIYGSQRGDLTEETIPMPISSYGWMKLASEEALRTVCAEGKIDKLLIARFPNVTGKYQTHGVVYDLVRRMKLDSRVLRVLGDGRQKKPFGLAEDLVTDLWKAIALIGPGVTTLNFAPSDRATVREIATEVVSQFGQSTQIEFGIAPIGWAGDVAEYSLDAQKAQSLLGGLSFGSSKDAIRHAVEWAINAES